MDARSTSASSSSPATCSPTSTSARIVAFHDEHEALATIGLIRVENPLEFGIVITREDGSIERFLEKPTWGQVFSDTINTGIFVLEPEIFDYIAPTVARSTSRSEVFPKLLADGRPLYGAVAEGYWEDVGTLEAYLRAHKDVLDEQGRSVDIPGFRIGDGVWLGEGAEVAPRRRRRSGPAVIGDNCRVEAGRRLGAVHRARRERRGCAPTPTSSAPSSTTTPTSVEACRCGARSIGRSCDLRTNVRIEEGVVLGDECFVGERRRASAGDVKVYPFKTVEAGAIVNTSIVWESQGRPQPVRPRRRERPGQRRHHARAGGQGGDGLRHHA